MTMRNALSLVLAQLFSLDIQGSDSAYVGIRQARDRRDVISGVKLYTITAEILDDVSAVSEVIHNVAEIPCVLEPQRVAEFVQARQIDDAITQEDVFSGALREIRPQ
jgi:hypothetical protein